MTSGTRATATIALVLLGFVAEPRAQVPILTPYFNAAGTWSVHCEYCDPYHPGPDYPLTVHFILTGFNDWVSAIEFSVSYPFYVSWLGDVGAPPVTFGDTPTGISMGWALPQNGFGPLDVLQANIVYHATCTHGELRLEVRPHPISGKIQAVRWGDNSLVALQGGVAKFCSRSVATETQTWGAIKALYE